MEQFPFNGLHILINAEQVFILLSYWTFIYLFSINIIGKTIKLHEFKIILFGIGIFEWKRAGLNIYSTLNF